MGHGIAPSTAVAYVIDNVCAKKNVVYGLLFCYMTPQIVESRSLFETPIQRGQILSTLTLTLLREKGVRESTNNFTISNNNCLMLRVANNFHSSYFFEFYYEKNMGRGVAEEKKFLMIIIIRWTVVVVNWKKTTPSHHILLLLIVSISFLLQSSPRKAQTTCHIVSPHLNCVLQRPCFRAPNDRRYNGSQSHSVQGLIRTMFNDDTIAGTDCHQFRFRIKFYAKL